LEYVAASALLPEMPVELDVTEGDWPGLYPSRIESVAGRNITLLAPTRDNVWVPLRPGTGLVARATSSRGVLSWDTRVIERRVLSSSAPPVLARSSTTRDPRRFLLVGRPDKLLIVQRRAFFRVPARFSVLVLPTQVSGAPAENATSLGESAAREQAALLVDLSGGGAALRTTTASLLPLRPADWLRVRLPLPDRHARSGDDELLLAGEVIGVDTRRVRWDQERIVRVRWSGLSGRDEDRLLRFVRDLERLRLKDRRASRDL
jgi:hypothetical protein